MVTPGYLLYSSRENLHLSRRHVAEGICTASAIAQYELGYLTPTDKKLDLLCPKLGIERDYMALVVVVHRKIMKDLNAVWKCGDYRTASKLFRELARREQMPTVKARYTDSSQFCNKIVLGVQ